MAGRGRPRRADDSNSQPPAKQNAKARNRLPENEDAEMEIDGADDDEEETRFKAEKSSAMVRYFLIFQQSKKFVKRSDLIKHCMDNEKMNLYKEILDEAKAKMRHFFGIDILQHPEKKDHYYLLNKIHRSDNAQTGSSRVNRRETAADGLLYAILSAIFMKAPETKELYETQLAAFLRPLKVELDDTKHPGFGDVKKLMKRFVDQGWLIVRKITLNNDLDTFVYAWGWRSISHLSRVDMFNIACDVMKGDRDRAAVARQWDHIFKLAQREDEEVKRLEGD